jgi:hypothetical protein
MQSTQDEYKGAVNVWNSLGTILKNLLLYRISLLFNKLGDLILVIPTHMVLQTKIICKTVCNIL